ncbi:MAG: Opine dehydrogenase [Firmicutes bacterium]|nr:Opine dehydrogenase [Bacillota bacterium]
MLKTSLDNIGAIFHPALTILNAGRIESTHGEFEFYMDGATPAVTRVLETLDNERVAVAAALGIRAMSAREWLYVAYDAPGRTLFEAMQANIGYKGISAPPTTLMRYITEDVPMSLVPIASIGAHLGVPTPMMDSMIHLASVIHDVDYWADGRTVDTMGISTFSVKQIRQLVLEGKLDA